MKRFFTLYIILAFIAFAPAQAQQTKRIFMIGNSVTDRLKFDGFKAFALSQNNTHIYSTHIIPGSPLGGIWASYDTNNNPPFGSTKNAFENYDWDAVTLQPFDSGLENDKAIILNYARLIKDKNPNVQFYIYSRYPRTPQGKTFETATGEDWKKLWEYTYGAGGQTNEHRKFFEDLRNAFNATDRGGLNKEALLMPLGDILYAFNEKAMKGEVPGHASAWDLYSDGIHMNGAGEYLVMITFYTTIYKEDIRGTKVPANYGVINPTLVEMLQQTVYEVVFNHPYSGTTLADIVPVTGVALDKTELDMKVFNRAQLKASIEPANASKKGIIWNSSNPGVVMTDQTGKITSLSAGTAIITATSLDGSYTDVCEITVSGEINGTKTNGVLAHWDFRETTSVAANNTPAKTTLSGISETNVCYGAGLNARGWEHHFVTTGHIVLDLLSSIGDNKYIGFKVKPKDGSLITIDEVKFMPFNETGTRFFALCSSINGFVDGNEISVREPISGDQRQELQTVPIVNHTNLDEVEFRVYIYGRNNPFEGVGIGGGVGGGVVGGAGNSFIVTGSIFTPQNEAPSAPGEVRAVNVSDTAISFEWEEATDDYFVKGYNFYLDGVIINEELIEETIFTLENLTSGQLCDITVEAVDYFGVVSETKASLAIHANRPPVAKITPSESNGKVPLTVTFNSDASTDPDEDEGDKVLGFDWYINDEKIQNSSNSLEHIFTKKGTYEVALIVMDERGMRSVESSKTTITVTADKYTVSITNGTTDPAADEAYEGDEITIVAEIPNDEGIGFDKWESDDVEFADEKSEITTFVMPSKAVAITATHKAIEYTITVTGGTADKTTASIGEVVTITVERIPESFKFDKWTSDDAELADEKSEITTFVMPAKNVAIKATVISRIGIEQSVADKVTIFPNPATDYIQVAGIADAPYTITSVTGAKMLAGILPENEAINISSLNQGIYFILIDNKISTFIKK